MTTVFDTETDGLLNEMAKIHGASVVIDLSREKEADSLEGRNTTYIRVEKNRPCSEEGMSGTMRFNLDTFTLREVG